MSERRRVAILFGGRSGEHEVSLASARSVMANLDPLRYDVRPVGIDREGTWLTGDDPMARLSHPARDAGSAAPLSHRPVAAADPSVLAGVEVVFPVLHGPFGEDGTIQGLLELAALPYVGAGVAASAVAMDKLLYKGLATAASLPQLPYVGLGRHEWEAAPEETLDRIEAALPYPMFVKPANLGSSVGISKVGTRAELAAALDLAGGYDRRLLVEQGLERPRELEVAVLGNEWPEASVVGEIAPHEQYEFYDYASKYGEGEADLLIPAPLDDRVAARLRSLALRAFQVADGAGLARVDFLMDRESGALYLNEVNTMPGFTVTSMYPKLWEATGLPYPALLDRLIALALERHAQNARHRGRGRDGSGVDA